MPAPGRLSVATGLGQVDPKVWDALVGEDHPFVRHAFLHGLEASGSVGSIDSGWLPRHLLAWQEQRLVGALPLYLKSDSFGEYIFDHAWAQGAQAAGLSYYPKLVAAVPFSPVSGPRLLTGAAPAAEAAAIADSLVAGSMQLARRLGASGVHVLFPCQAQLGPWRQRGFLPRRTLQFHWQRQAGWQQFDDFCASLRAPARKQLRRERRGAQAHGLQLRVRLGDQMSQEHWQAMYDFYRQTIDRKHGHAYLSAAFFAHLQAHLGGQVLCTFAERQGRPVAGALFVRSQQVLWGRSWGAAEALDGMHFELCYHLAVEWGLAHGIERIEAGAQGLHKLKRGFLPAACHSMHWLDHPGLHRAVEGFLQQEAGAIDQQLQALSAHTPFSREGA